MAFNKIRPKRSRKAGVRPKTDAGNIGEIFTNIPDRQIGVHDEHGNPIDLVAVRQHSAHSTYRVKDLVVYNGHIYKALVNISVPRAFRITQWENISSRGTSTPGTSGGIVPIPVSSDKGKLLGVDKLTGKPAWGAVIDSQDQEINGGSF
jgi:hypothetical protein